MENYSNFCSELDFHNVMKLDSCMKMVFPLQSLATEYTGNDDDDDG